MVVVVRDSKISRYAESCKATTPSWNDSRQLALYIHVNSPSFPNHLEKRQGSDQLSRIAKARLISPPYPQDILAMHMQCASSALLPWAPLSRLVGWLC